MKPANEVRITRDQQVLVDGINIPSVLRCEASMNPDLETSVTIYVYAGRIAIQGYTAYEDFQPDGSAGIEELLVTEDGRALINGIEIPGAKSVNVIADPLTDPEVSIRVCTRKITINLIYRETRSFVRNAGTRRRSRFYRRPRLLISLCTASIAGAKRS